MAQADAEALIRDHGAGAYSEARQRERDRVSCRTGQLMPAGSRNTGDAWR